MKVLFAGGVEGNNGPANANRAFVEHWPHEDEVLLIDGVGKIEKLLSLLKSVFIVDVVLSTGSGRLSSLASFIAKARGKAVIGFCHGYAPYENKINSLGMSEKEVEAFKSWLDHCDCVVTNSKLQMEFLATRQPSLVGKLAYANLGVSPFPWKGKGHAESAQLIVAVSGGTRPIKANEVVARAVSILRRCGIDARLDVYGGQYSSNAELDTFVKAGYVRYLGQVDRMDFLNGLRASSVFVMNSRRESFGLSALDAVEVGTSVLLSRNCGVNEILELKEGDLVNDCEDSEEVASKIKALWRLPNAERIYKGLDFEALSWWSSALKLRNICAEVAGFQMIAR